MMDLMTSCYNYTGVTRPDIVVHDNKVKGSNYLYKL